MVELTYAENALRKAHHCFTQRNPESLKAHQNAHHDLPGGNTRSVLHAEPFPITWASGKDATLTSIDGHTYTDLLGEFSAGIYGHSEQRIAQAVAKAMEYGWNFGGNSQLEKQFAHKVCNRFGPSGIDLVRFTNSGTEANTTVLGAALAITGRRKILVFSGGYHGSTLIFPMALMKGSVSPTMNLPHDFVFAPYNNIAETAAVVASLQGGDALAAILVEPVQGSGGCRPAIKGFLQYLRQLADTTGALLILDEIMCSRLGKAGHGATLGVQGDFVTLGKYIAGGMTFGAFGGRRDLMECFNPATGKLFHPGTYNNNILSMSAGLVGLDIYNADEVDRLNQLGEYLKEQIQKILIEEGIYPQNVSSSSIDLAEVDSFENETAIQAGKGQPLERLPLMFVTGRGSMLNVRFSGPEAAVWQALYWHHMMANDIHIAVRGYTPLHLKLDASHVQDYIDAIRSFVQQHKAQLCAPESRTTHEREILPKPSLLATSTDIAASA